MGWKLYGECECGWFKTAPSGKIFFISNSICPKCGSDKKSWSLKTKKWVPTHKLFNPKTWFSGYWENM